MHVLQSEVNPLQKGVHLPSLALAQLVSNRQKDYLSHFEIMNEVFLLGILLVEVLLHREDSPVLPEVLLLDGAEVGHPLMQSMQDPHLDMACVEELVETVVEELQLNVFVLKLEGDLLPGFSQPATEFFG